MSVIYFCYVLINVLFVYYLQTVKLDFGTSMLRFCLPEAFENSEKKFCRKSKLNIDTISLLLWKEQSNLEFIVAIYLTFVLHKYR